MRISRQFAFKIGANGRCALTTVLATTQEINFESMAAGLIAIPSGSPITSLAFYAACWSTASKSEPGTAQDTPAPTFLPLTTQAGSVITVTVVAGQCYPFPPECGGAGALKIVVNANGPVDISTKG